MANYRILLLWCLISPLDFLNIKDTFACYKEDKSLACCIGYHHDNGICAPCPKGSTTFEIGGNCTQCDAGFFGDSCISLCECDDNEICDNEKGCIVPAISTDSQMMTTVESLLTREEASTLCNHQGQMLTPAASTYVETKKQIWTSDYVLCLDCVTNTGLLVEHLPKTENHRALCVGVEGVSRKIISLNVEKPFDDHDHDCYWHHFGNRPPNSLLNISRTHLLQEAISLMKHGVKYWVSDVNIDMTMFRRRCRIYSPTIKSFTRTDRLLMTNCDALNTYSCTNGQTFRTTVSLVLSNPNVCGVTLKIPNTQNDQNHTTKSVDGDHPNSIFLYIVIGESALLCVVLIGFTVGCVCCYKYTKRQQTAKDRKVKNQERKNAYIQTYLQSPRISNEKIDGQEMTGNESDHTGAVIEPAGEGDTRESGVSREDNNSSSSMYLDYDEPINESEMKAPKSDYYEEVDDTAAGDGYLYPLPDHSEDDLEARYESVT